jgi:polar amino acid transport system substrate-binding protein
MRPPRRSPGVNGRGLAGKAPVLRREGFVGGRGPALYHGRYNPLRLLPGRWQVPSITPRRVLRPRRARPLIAVLGLFALAVGSPARAQGPLHLVSTAWPPFTDRPGEARFALDLVEEALKRIGVTADTTIVEDANFTSALLRGEFDGSAAAWKDAERERVLLFSDPYLQNRLILVGRRGSDVSAKTLADLTGKRVVLVGGYSYGDDVASGGGPFYLRSTSEENSLSMLLNNAADYTLMDELVVRNILDNYAEEARARLAFGSTPLITRSLYLAIRRTRSDAAAIINRFNAELRSMVADRTYHRLLHVDWISTDVDGDGRAELVPRTDQPGPTPPAGGYDLTLSIPAANPPPPRTEGPRYYVGGSIYEGWSAVPERYKVRRPNEPDPSRSGFNVFRFEW